LQRETKDDQLMKVIGETEKQKQASLIKCTWFRALWWQIIDPRKESN